MVKNVIGSQIRLLQWGGKTSCSGPYSIGTEKHFHLYVMYNVCSVVDYVEKFVQHSSFHHQLHWLKSTSQYRARLLNWFARSLYWLWCWRSNRWLQRKLTSCKILHQMLKDLHFYFVLFLNKPLSCISRPDDVTSRLSQKCYGFLLVLFERIISSVFIVSSLLISLFYFAADFISLLLLLLPVFVPHLFCV